MSRNENVISGLESLHIQSSQSQIEQNEEMSAVSGNSNRMPPNMGGNQQVVLNFKIPVRKE
jgi:hypothetical protein